MHILLLYALLLCWRPGAVFAQGETRVKFTRLQCTSQNASLVVVRECRVRPISRFVGSLSARIGLLPPPWYKVIANVEVFRKYNTYKPFIINYTTDICEFLRYRKHPFFRYIFELGGNYHNINHTCPYQDDLIVRNFIPPSVALKLPLAAGQYKMVVRTYGKRQALLFYVLFVELYFEIVETFSHQKK